MQVCDDSFRARHVTPRRLGCKHKRLNVLCHASCRTKAFKLAEQLQAADSLHTAAASLPPASRPPVSHACHCRGASLWLPPLQLLGKNISVPFLLT